MFFEGNRIDFMRQMILAVDEVERRAALKKLLPFQKKDFVGLFRAMEGRPVTIRLLDPPLHEFLPHDLATTFRRKGHLTNLTGSPENRTIPSESDHAVPNCRCMERMENISRMVSV